MGYVRKKAHPPRKCGADMLSPKMTDQVAGPVAGTVAVHKGKGPPSVQNGMSIRERERPCQGEGTLKICKGRLGRRKWREDGIGQIKQKWD